MATEATTQTTALAAAKRKEFRRSIIELAGMLPVLVVICILFAILTPNFLTQNNLVNVVRQASINIVLASGMTFVILTGGIDLSVGSVLAFTAVIAVVVSLIPGLEWAAIPAALLAGLLVGVLTGMMIAYVGLPPFIVTLGTFTAIRGAAYLAAGGGRWRGGQRAGSGSAAQAADWAISSWQRAWAWSFHGMGRALREIEVVRVNEEPSPSDEARLFTRAPDQARSLACTSPVYCRIRQ